MNKGRKQTCKNCKKRHRHTFLYTKNKRSFIECNGCGFISSRQFTESKGNRIENQLKLKGVEKNV